MAETKNPWHYISKEGYPKKEGKYLVACFEEGPSFIIETFYTNMMKASYYLPRKKGFCYWDSEWGTCYDENVFAWMDIPELPTRKELENGERLEEEKTRSL